MEFNYIQPLPSCSECHVSADDGEKDKQSYVSAASRLRFAPDFWTAWVCKHVFVFKLHIDKSPLKISSVDTFKKCNLWSGPEHFVSKAGRGGGRVNFSPWQDIQMGIEPICKIHHPVYKTPTLGLSWSQYSCVKMPWNVFWWGVFGEYKIYAQHYVLLNKSVPGKSLKRKKKHPAFVLSVWANPPTRWHR